MMEMKKCNLCHKTKAVGDFSLSRKNVDGRLSKCRSCAGVNRTLSRTSFNPIIDGRVRQNF